MEEVVVLNIPDQIDQESNRSALSSDEDVCRIDLQTAVIEISDSHSFCRTGSNPRDRNTNRYLIPYIRNLQREYFKRVPLYWIFMMETVSTSPNSDVNQQKDIDKNHHYVKIHVETAQIPRYNVFGRINFFKAFN
ncbi:hypothetical protein V1477_007115 [Vespula maculifrons]|uniref:Uncharacterized protein n=1 Tax=Vespula maculifrons TaxID=7453 RepID=A0ABD2CK77_VESMC